MLAPPLLAEAGAALAVSLPDGPAVADLGTAAGAPERAVAEVADRSVLVLRGCYLALRRAVRSPLAPRIAGVVLVEEPGRSLGARDVADVLGRPVLARVPAQASIARAVDAGVLAARLPEALARPATLLLDRLGLIDRAGRAA
ncbi:MAG: hypothetical protein M5U14_18565 [Acidimicrobiia bacterium]|nr:hypothetical protein [Acidimicrobiia bacterium]